MNTFTWRLTLWFGALVTATTALLLTAGGWLLHREMNRGIELMHEVEGKELAELIGARDDLTIDELRARIERDSDSDAGLYFMQVHRENGPVMFRSDNLGAVFLPSPPIEHAHWTATLPEIGLVRVSEFRHGVWHIQVASRLGPLRRVLREYARVSGVLVLLAAAVGVGLGYGFSRITLRPVRAIEQTARRIRGDNLSERIPVPAANDELAALTRLLNQMFDRLELAFAQVQRFTADASHELKTPLALIQLNAEKLRSRLGPDPEAAAAMGDLSEELARLHQIIESLLFLSKAESGALEVHRRTILLPGWLEDFAEDARVLAEDRGARFTLGRHDAGELQGEPTLLRQLLLNLVSNALNVVPPGGEIRIDANREDQGWCWVITDDGPGLPPEHLEAIFERFVQLGNHHTPERAGHGLGLAICRSIAALHGGLIRAQNRTDRRGLQVVVWLPDQPGALPAA